MLDHVFGKLVGWPGRECGTSKLANNAAFHVFVLSGADALVAKVVSDLPGAEAGGTRLPRQRSDVSREDAAPRRGCPPDGLLGAGPSFAWRVGQTVGVDRPLTATERLALNVLLVVDFPGAAELRIQATTARVVGRCECGCPTVDLTVEDVAPVAEVVSRVPIEADVLGGQGGGLMLFVQEGRLSCLEYWYVADKPAEFPPPDRIRPVA